MDVVSAIAPKVRPWKEFCKRHVSLSRLQSGLVAGSLAKDNPGAYCMTLACPHASLSRLHKDFEQWVFLKTPLDVWHILSLLSRRS